MLISAWQLRRMHRHHPANLWWAVCSFSIMADCVAQLVALVESVPVGSAVYGCWMQASALAPRCGARKVFMRQFRHWVVLRLLELDASVVQDVRFYYGASLEGAGLPGLDLLATAYVDAYELPANMKSGKPNPVRVHYRVEATFWLIGKEGVLQAFQTLLENGVQLPASFFLGNRLVWLTSPAIATSQKEALLELAGTARGAGAGGGEGGVEGLTHGDVFAFGCRYIRDPCRPAGSVY